MGPRLLCFVAGAAMAAFFVHVGLLATPFFGAGAFLWANVFASFLLCLALGYGLGDALAHVAGPKSAERAGPRLAALGGILAWLGVYLLPLSCRLVLEHDPEWVLAPTCAVLLVTVIPGALMAGVVPSELRARLAGIRRGDPSDVQPVPGSSDDDDTAVRIAQGDGRAAARSALRLLGLMTAGGVAGVALSARSLLRADQVDVWIPGYVAGPLLAAIAWAFLGKRGRIVVALGIATTIAVTLVKPSEAQSVPFAVALETAWKRGHGASIYYLRTSSDDPLLTNDDLRKVSERVRAEEVGKPGVVLACELLQRLGKVRVSGDGLHRSLQLLIPPQVQSAIMPIFLQLEEVESEPTDARPSENEPAGNLLKVKIRQRRGEEGARFRIPGEKPGEYTEIWFRRDFEVHLTEKDGVWRLEFGPLETEKAGIFDLHDTHRTPVEIPNVKLWVDASLLALVIEDHPDQVIIKAVAQGSIGDVETVVVTAQSKL